MYKDVETRQEGIRIHITGYSDSDEGCTLRGYAIDSKGVRIDGSKTLRRVAPTAADVPSAEQHLVSAVINALAGRRASGAHAKSNPEELDLEHPMVQAFSELVEQKRKVSAAWNDETQQRYLTGFRGRVLPFITSFLYKEFTIADRDELLNKIVEKVFEDKHASCSRVTALKTARKNLAGYAAVYAEMRRIDPMLPDLDLAPPRRKNNITAEQIKSLPNTVRRKFAKRLKELISKEPKLVLGAVLMWDAALRTAEAAAVIPALDIKINGLVMIVLVCWQEKGGLRSPILKTNAAYRKVPLSAWGTEMVELCCEQIAAWPEHPNAPITADELRRFIKSILNECGLENDFWTAVQAEEAREITRKGERKDTSDPVAYTLRHDRASIWRNVCGLTVAECDYYLGHEDRRPKKRRTDYRLDTEIQRIARKLENYVCDPKMSKHPALVPIPLEHGEDFDVPPFEEIVYRNTSDSTLSVNLDITASEGAESIAVETIGGSIVTSAMRRINTRGKREDKPVIGTGQLAKCEEMR